MHQVERTDLLEEQSRIIRLITGRLADLDAAQLPLVDERIHGVTLEQEERIKAREAELERISARAEIGQQKGRERRARAAIARLLAEAVAGGRDVTSAVVRLVEALETATVGVVPIGRLEDVGRKEVSIEGHVETLWEPSHPSIAQVGLVADETGRTRVTVWRASRAAWMVEGEQVRIHEAARNWYEGRVSLAVTGRTTIHFPARERRWA